MDATADSEECIHGLSVGACDICYPKARPEPETPVHTATVRTPRKSTPSRAAGARAVDVSTRRIYHVTHLDNLPFIIDAGAIIAGAEPAIDVSAPGVREARAGISTPDGSSVAEHVPFFAGLDSSLWASIVAGESDPRIATSAAAADFAILVTSMAAVPDAVVTDGDAAHPLTRFATPETASRMLTSLARDTTGRALDAEVLVPGSVPISALSLITVANDRAQRVARDVGFDVRVAIHPPWFLPRVAE